MFQVNSSVNASKHENDVNQNLTDTENEDHSELQHIHQPSDQRKSNASIASSVTDISHSEAKGGNNTVVKTDEDEVNVRRDALGSQDTKANTKHSAQPHNNGVDSIILPQSDSDRSDVSIPIQVLSRPGSTCSDIASIQEVPSQRGSTHPDIASAKEAVSRQVSAHSDRKSSRQGSTHLDVTSPTDRDPAQQDSMEPLIIEKGGAFQFVDSEDIKAEEHDKSRRSSADSERRASSSQTENSDVRGRKLTPEYNSRPARSKSAYAASPPRETSKESSSKSKHETYRMTEEEKEKLERQKAKRREQDEMEREKREREEKRKKDECDAAFHEWLKVKRDEAAKRRRQNREERKKLSQKRSEQKEEGKDAFSEWLKVKRQQEKKSKKAADDRDKEDAEATEKHSRKQAERAFKKWLRKKRREARLARTQSHSVVKRNKQQPSTTVAS